MSTTIELPRCTYTVVEAAHLSSSTNVEATSGMETLLPAHLGMTLLSVCHNFILFAPTTAQQDCLSSTTDSLLLPEPIRQE